MRRAIARRTPIASSGAGAFERSIAERAELDASGDLVAVTLPVNSSLIGIGWVMFADQVNVSPSILPSLSASAPCGPFISPVSLSPSVYSTRVAFCAPIGVFIVTFQLPSALICLSFHYVNGPAQGRMVEIESVG